MDDLISRQAAIDALYDWSNHSMTNAETWHLRQVIGDIKSMPSAQPESDVHYGEMVNKHSFCDFIRDWMSKKLDPTVIRPEEMTHKMLYRSWVELWWMLDHYFEHDPPKWGDEKEEDSE